MKKILIVNDNLALGGIQKSLINFLCAVHNEYEITLLLLNRSGALLEKIPNNVRVISANRALSVLGASRKELEKMPLLYVWKGILLLITRKFSKKIAWRIVSLFQNKINGFDVAISFSHSSKGDNLTSCSAEFVLDKVKSFEKICFIHCDYQNAENHCEYTNDVYRLFDKIACCSDSVKKHFLNVLPDLQERTYTVRNFYDLSIKWNDKSQLYQYDQNYINLVSVARLTSEKGIERAINALSKSRRKDVKYFIVGDGPNRTDIEKLIKDKKLTDSIVLLGETDKPYIYMKNADYLLVPSYHEAAPMVFDEAHLLGLKVITTNTTSAIEMIKNENGIVCENSEEGIRTVLCELKKYEKNERSHLNYTNDFQKNQFANILES